jgi:hypothetical protein
MHNLLPSKKHISEERRQNRTVTLQDPEPFVWLPSLCSSKNLSTPTTTSGFRYLWVSIEDGHFPWAGSADSTTSFHGVSQTHGTGNQPIYSINCSPHLKLEQHLFETKCGRSGGRQWRIRSHIQPHTLSAACLLYDNLHILSRLPLEATVYAGADFLRHLINITF